MPPSTYCSFDSELFVRNALSILDTASLQILWSLSILRQIALPIKMGLFSKCHFKMHILRLSMAQEVILWCGGNVNVMSVPALLCVNAKLNHITLQTGSLFLGIWQMDKNTVSCCTDTHTHISCRETARPNCSYPLGCTTPVHQCVAFNDNGITVFHRYCMWCVVMGRGIILYLNSVTGTLKGGRRCIWTLLWQILSQFWWRGNKYKTDTHGANLNELMRKTNSSYWTGDCAKLNWCVAAAADY